MCLISQNLKPFVAKKDLKVFKTLLKDETGAYRTPFINHIVELNSLMESDRIGGYDEYNYGNNYGSEGHKCQLEIGTGYIHSSFQSNQITGGIFQYEDIDKVCVVAYIPKGAEYYIDVKFNNVCSNQLRLTDEIVDTKDAVLTRDEIMDILSPVGDSIDKEKVCAGWLVRSDKSFIHPSECTTGKIKQDIIGVVGGIINGNVIVVSLDETISKWCVESDKTRFPFLDGNDRYSDFNGREYTDAVKNSAKYKKDNSYFPAFDFCLKYETKGTKSGDWYLPSTGEQHVMYNMNRDVINYSLFIVGATLIKSYFYWTSAYYSTMFAWSLSTVGALPVNWNKKWSTALVRPSLAIKAD